MRAIDRLGRCALNSSHLWSHQDISSTVLQAHLCYQVVSDDCKRLHGCCDCLDAGCGICELGSIKGDDKC